MKTPKNARAGRNAVVYYPSYPAATPVSLYVTAAARTEGGGHRIWVETNQGTNRVADWNPSTGRWEIRQTS